ncbi:MULTISPECIES: hypothetical protein [unclassified Pseudomonas]|uniref:hypothetical protein n=1 Tax=unclassified Pseudomonas TaxID=196821 RepID=UPI0015A1E898|nr:MULTISPECIES: hypothetical protein [unclassified Pseudomonas]NWC96956.1 hypothetical protein [Pseudomonas sp. IPO3779]NWD21395.1 hypothetical protein [Pseudomonas sp. IPO3778]
MHSLFFATAQLINGRVPSVDSMDNDHAPRMMPLELQAKICIALGLFALGSCFALWLIGAYA